MPKSSKMLQFLNWRVRITIQENRFLEGTFLAFDKHMNIVLAECCEFRRIVPKGKKKSEEKEEKRMLGFVLLRGETVISMVPQAPPAPKAKVGGADAAGRGGPGVGRAAGRGIPAPHMSAPPQGLSGPVSGIGGPAPHMMMPRGAPAPPGGYGRGFPPGPPMGRGFPPGAAPPGFFPPPPGGRGMPPMMPPGFPPQHRGPPGPPQ